MERLYSYHEDDMSSPSSDDAVKGQFRALADFYRNHVPEKMEEVDNRPSSPLPSNKGGVDDIPRDGDQKSKSVKSNKIPSGHYKYRKIGDNHWRTNHITPTHKTVDGYNGDGNNNNNRYHPSACSYVNDRDDNDDDSIAEDQYVENGDEDQDDIVTPVRPTDAFFSHREPYKIRARYDRDDGGPSNDDEVDDSYYMIPKSDGEEFTDEDVVPVLDADGNIVPGGNSSDVADMMNNYNLSERNRQQFNTILGKHKKLWKKNMDNLRKSKSEPFSFRWIANFRAREMAFERDPLYRFINDVAGELSLPKAELLMDSSFVEDRVNMIQKRLEAVQEKWKSHVKAAEVAYAVLQNVEADVDRNNRMKSHFFSYYMPIINLGSRDTEGAYSILSRLVDILDESLKQQKEPVLLNTVNSRTILNIPKKVPNVTPNYVHMFIQLCMLSVYVQSTSTLGTSKQAGNLVDALIMNLSNLANKIKADDKSDAKSAFIKQVSLLVETKFSIPEEVKMGDVVNHRNAFKEFESFFHRITSELSPLFESITQILAYGVSVKSSNSKPVLVNENNYPSSRLLFVNEATRSLAAKIAQSPNADKKLLKVTTESVYRPEPKALEKLPIKPDVSHIDLAPYIPSLIVDPTKQFQWYIFESLRIDTNTYPNPDTNQEVFIRLLTQIANFEDSLQKWQSIELDLSLLYEGGGGGGGGAMAGQNKGSGDRGRATSFDTWALTELSTAEKILRERSLLRQPDKQTGAMVKVYKELPDDIDGIIIKPVFTIIENILSRLSSGVLLSDLAELSHRLVRAMENKNLENTVRANLHLPDLTSEIISAHRLYLISERLAYFYLAHVFFDVRFTFWYIITRYQLVRAVLLSITNWLIRPSYDKLKDARAKWSKLSNDSTNPAELRKFLQSEPIQAEQLRWILLPENTGIIKMSPVLQSAVENAILFVRTFCTQNSGLKNIEAVEVITNEDVNSQEFKKVFARLTAFHIVKARLLQPTGLITKMTVDEIKMANVNFIRTIKQYRRDGLSANPRFIRFDQRNT